MRLLRMALICICWCAVYAIAPAEDKSPLKPLMNVPKEVVYESDFSKAKPLAKAEWQPRQGTRWAIEDGVLRGRPSSAVYQASKADHKGLEPRIAAPITPNQFIVRATVRFIDGKETAVVPFIEFTHHKVRVQFSKSGLWLLADHESVKLAESKDFVYKPGEWYTFLAELNGEEFCIQFANGPTFYAKHACFAEKGTTGAEGLGIAGPQGGSVELKAVTMWSIQPKVQPSWEKTRSKFPEFKPVPVKAKKEK